MAKDSRFGQGVPLSRQFRGGFSVGEIQRLGRLRAKALLSVQSTASKYSIGDTPPLAISLPERCPVCEGDALAEAASVSLKNLPKRTRAACPQRSSCQNPRFSFLYFLKFPFKQPINNYITGQCNAHNIIVPCHQKLQYQLSMQHSSLVLGKEMPLMRIEAYNQIIQNYKSTMPAKAKSIASTDGRDQVQSSRRGSD